MARENEAFELYNDRHGDWRWRLKAKNGKIIADSAEGYKNRSHAFKMASNLWKYAEDADIYPID
jgi:uncharacterized protein YegP (UPF0339 family)